LVIEKITFLLLSLYVAYKKDPERVSFIILFFLKKSTGIAVFGIVTYYNMASPHNIKSTIQLDPPIVFCDGPLVQSVLHITKFYYPDQFNVFFT